MFWRDCGFPVHAALPIVTVSIFRRTAAAAACLALAGCLFTVGPPPRPMARSAEQDAFFRRLTALCGHGYPGRMTEGADSTFAHNPLAIHVRGCTADEVRIGFIIAADSSRTWVVRRTPGGLALTHDFPEAQVTGYGGTTVTRGTSERQDFAADTATARRLPPAANNVWTLEIIGGSTFSYTVARAGVRQRFRLEFDLRNPIG
jgi:hypothetical protein